MQGFAKTFAAAAAVSMIGLAAPAVAHHSVYGAFDKDAPLAARGVVTRVDWINPHTFVTLEATDAKGVRKVWRLESQPPSFMRRAGVTKDMLLAGGKPVQVVLLPARKEGVGDVGFLVSLKGADGKLIQFVPEK